MTNEEASGTGVTPPVPADLRPVTIRTKRVLSIWAHGPTLVYVRDFLDDQAFEAIEREDDYSGIVGRIVGQNIDERTYLPDEERWTGSVQIQWEDKH